MTQNKNSRWSFTTWKRPVCRKQELVWYEVWQREFTDTHMESKIHYQGYVEFRVPYTKTQVKNLYSDKGMHLEEARESREMNTMYCTKPESYYGERYMYHGPGQLFYRLNPFIGTPPP